MSLVAVLCPLPLHTWLAPTLLMVRAGDQPPLRLQRTAHGCALKRCPSTKRRQSIRLRKAKRPPAAAALHRNAQLGQRLGAGVHLPQPARCCAQEPPNRRHPKCRHQHVRYTPPSPAQSLASPRVQDVQADVAVAAARGGKSRRIRKGISEKEKGGVMGRAWERGAYGR